MMTNKVIAGVLAGGLFLLAALGALTQAADEPPGAESAEMEAMMAMALEAGTPGESHARLKPAEGKWAVTMLAWMKPGDEPQASTGESVFTWILDGRFLRQEFSGDWVGMTYRGLGHIGYDNIRQEYVSTWMDNMSTGLLTTSGRYDEAANMIKEEGAHSCPMTGETHRWFRSEWTLPVGDSHTYVMYSKDEDGTEFKSMEITYRRAE